jgi:hypothetical protein
VKNGTPPANSTEVGKEPARTQTTDKSQTNLSKSDALKQSVQSILDKSLNTLQSSFAGSPDNVKPALQKAIDASKTKQENISNIGTSSSGTPTNGSSGWTSSQNYQINNGSSSPVNTTNSTRSDNKTSITNNTTTPLNNWNNNASPTPTNNQTSTKSFFDR